MVFISIIIPMFLFRLELFFFFSMITSPLTVLCSQTIICFVTPFAVSAYHLNTLINIYAVYTRAPINACLINLIRLAFAQ